MAQIPLYEYLEIKGKNNDLVLRWGTNNNDKVYCDILKGICQEKWDYEFNPLVRKNMSDEDVRQIHLQINEKYLFLLKNTLVEFASIT